MDTPFEHPVKSETERARDAALEARRSASDAIHSFLADLGRVRGIAERSIDTDLRNIKEKVSFEHLARSFPKSIAVAGFAGGYLLSRALFGSRASMAPRGNTLNRLAAHVPPVSGFSGLLQRSRGMLPDEVTGQLRGIAVTLATQALTGFLSKHMQPSASGRAEPPRPERITGEVTEERPVMDRNKSMVPFPHHH